jgi:hypothetical protein
VTRPPSVATPVNTRITCLQHSGGHVRGARHLYTFRSVVREGAVSWELVTFGAIVMSDCPLGLQCARVIPLEGLSAETVATDGNCRISLTHSLHSEQAGGMATLDNHIQEVLGSISAVTSVILIEITPGFPQSLCANFGIVPINLPSEATHCRC